MSTIKTAYYTLERLLDVFDLIFHVSLDGKKIHTNITSEEKEQLKSKDKKVIFHCSYKFIT
jgi:hypothetical protein